MIEALVITSIVALFIALFMLWLFGGPEYRIVQLTDGLGDVSYCVEIKVFRFLYFQRGTPTRYLVDCETFILRESKKRQVLK
jgi:hypothetical protein